MYSKETKKIVIDDQTKVIDDYAFSDYKNLEEIVLPEYIEVIGYKAFCGCTKLKKITLPPNIKRIDSYAFANCTSLEEINIPISLHYLSEGLFSNCTKLKTIRYHNNINYIDDYALYNCISLENFDLPTNLSSLGKKALMRCKKIKIIHIGKNLDSIEVGALSLIDALEQIIVDKNNSKFLTLFNNTLLISKDDVIIQYAINSKEEEIEIGYYEETYKINNEEQINSKQLIYNIADYAFAGAKYLKKIYLPSELESIGNNTFKDCPNLKELVIYHTSYGQILLLHTFQSSDNTVSIPFTNITIDEGITTLCDNMSEIFINAENITLPSSLEHIGQNIFTKASKLKKLVIPNNVKMISPNTFHDNTLLIFSDFNSIKANNFNMLQTKTNEDFYLKNKEKDNIRIFSLKDGTYYVKIDDYDTVVVTTDEIKRIASNPDLIINEPDELIYYLINLLSINAEKSNILTSIWTNNNLKRIFENFINDIEYVNFIAKHKTNEIIRQIIEATQINDEFLFSGILIKKFSKKDLIKLLNNYNKSIKRFFRYVNHEAINTFQIDVDELINYCNLLEQYQQYDRFLYNPIFFVKLSKINQELLIKYYNKNIKNLLLNSKTLNYYNLNDLNDLINLCRALGVFSDDTIISQKLCTFINEKLLSDLLPNGNINPYCINGNKIHTFFNEVNPREIIDYEFISFFIKNYQELIEIENKTSGIIARIYNSFREISSTSTSHRGSQRHLSVTINKCLDFFLSQKFENVTEDNIELAQLLQKYYSENYVLSLAEMIIEQSKKAPRNIFSKIIIDDTNLPIYSYDESEDLKEEINENYSYEWLPKQDYDNLILGKYCSCCAHILGAGAGIMRASMILDNTQNLIIRNEFGNIIAKTTMYINRENGYAVFNTIEINSSYHKEDDLNKIYNAIRRGILAFVEQYNLNNEQPVNLITIGEYRNPLAKYFDEYPTILKSIDYKNYGYYYTDKYIGTYNGDDKVKQLLIYKK